MQTPQAPLHIRHHFAKEGGYASGCAIIIGLALMTQRFYLWQGHFSYLKTRHEKSLISLKG
jgi:hypothetical protein